MNPGLSLNQYLSPMIGGLSIGLIIYSFLRMVFQRFSISPRIDRPHPFLTRETLKKYKLHYIVLTILLVAGVLMLDFMKYLLVLLGVILWLFKKVVPQWKNKQISLKRLKAMKELFPQSIGMMIQALKTGQTVPQVLEYLSKECPPPLKDEFASVCAEVQLGSSTETALTNFGKRFPDFVEFHQFLESYKISRQTGANLTHLLEVLLEGMEEKGRLMRKMEAMTSQARLSGTMMGVLPVLLGFVFFLMDPSLMTPLFTQPAGWGILVLAGILETIGFMWIRRLLQLEY
jgi:tight adherence protein B